MVEETEIHSLLSVVPKVKVNVNVNANVNDDGDNIMNNETVTVSSIHTNRNVILRGIAIAVAAIALLTASVTQYKADADAANTKIHTNANIRLSNATTNAAHSFLEKVMRPCNVTKRCDPIVASDTFALCHISKCAGASWIHLLKPHFNMNPQQFWPQRESGLEWSVPYIQKHIEYNYLLTSVKSPRRHLWSLFTECKYDGWGKSVTRGTEFPNNNGQHATFQNGTNNETDLVDFSAWIDHFLLSNNGTGRPSMERLDMYNCYHASNYQSRAFTSQRKNPHGVQLEHELIPDLRATEEVYWKELNWVALVEFFHESQCLLFYRITLGKNESQAKNVSVAWAEEYLDKYCVCPGPHSVVEGKDHEDTNTNTVVVSIPVRHHKEGHRSEFWNMNPDLLERMANLTETDVRLYELSLYQFLNEMAWLESSLGRRVLCDDTALAKQEMELSYVLRNAPTTNITALFHLMKEFAADMNKSTRRRGLRL
jgi:hypothetical protein